MITVHPGSHAHRLIQILSSVGEISTSALYLLGNERVMAALVRKLETVQNIRFDKGGTVYRAKLIQVNGIRNSRTIRFYKKGLPVLNGLHPGLQDWYLGEFRGHSFSNDRFHIERNHRVAETLALCITANIETRPYILPMLQKTAILRVVPDSPSFYIARSIKRVEDEYNKTMYSRIIGALFYPGGSYSVFNTRDAVMKWSGRGELKVLGNLLELARMNAGIGDTPSALLFGRSADVALNTILESDKSLRAELRFDKIYLSIHFIPLDQNGARLLKMLVTPNWNEKLLNALFEESQRSYNKGTMEYDAIVDGTKILSHLDSDIARLIRFREALSGQDMSCEVICFPWQTGFLRTYLGSDTKIRELSMDAVETSLGI